MFFSILNAITVLAIPKVIKYMVDIALKFDSIKYVTNITKIGILLVFIIALQCFCSFYTNYYGHLFGLKIEQGMRSELFQHYLKLPLTFYDNQKTGTLLSYMTADLNNISDALHHIPEDIVTSFLTIIGALFILFKTNTTLSFFVLLILPILFIHSRINIPKMKKTFENTHENISIINTQIEDSLSGIRVVKSFANEKIEVDKFEKTNQNYFVSKKQNYLKIAAFSVGTTIIISFVLPIIIILGVFFVNNSIITISDLFLFIMYVSLFTSPINKILNMSEKFEDNLVKYERFFKIINTKSESFKIGNNVHKKSVAGNIRFNNVTFRYSNTSNYVLKNLNFNIKSNQHVALVGDSGVGKTTICNLISRFYELEEGSITIDNIDIKKYPLQYLRKQIGIVQQDVFLFNDTIENNIRYGNILATKEEIIHAAKKANIHEFIMSLPRNYYTIVGQRGIKLSGGQKQRLSIARVFLNKSSIIIFDEATSALDSKSEQSIHCAINELTKNKTTIIIAHRLSTVKSADRIIVLTEKGIVEEGSHCELIKKNGIYSGLCKTQDIMI